MSRTGPVLCDRCGATIPDGEAIAILNSLTHAINPAGSQVKYRVDLCTGCGRSYVAWFKEPTS